MRFVATFTYQVLKLLDEVNSILLVEVMHLRGPLLLDLGSLLSAEHLHRVGPWQGGTLSGLETPEAPADGHPGVACLLSCEVRAWCGL